MVSKANTKSPEDTPNEDHGDGVLGCCLEDRANDKRHTSNDHGPAGMNHCWSDWLKFDSGCWLKPFTSRKFLHIEKTSADDEACIRIPSAENKHDVAVQISRSRYHNELALQMAIKSVGNLPEGQLYMKRLANRNVNDPKCRNAQQI